MAQIKDSGRIGQIKRQPHYFGRAVAENKEFALMLLDKSREDQIRLINDNYDRLKEELLRDYSATEAQRKTSLI